MCKATSPQVGPSCFIPSTGKSTRYQESFLAFSPAILHPRDFYHGLWLIQQVLSKPDVGQATDFIETLDTVDTLFFKEPFGPPGAQSFRPFVASPNPQLSLWLIQQVLPWPGGDFFEIHSRNFRGNARQCGRSLVVSRPAQASPCWLFCSS
jgi:hypothetical protein